jgi:chemotaxis protein methyltransferase CheR
MMSRGASAAWTATGVAEPSQPEFEAFRDLIQRCAGIHLNVSKKALLYSRLSHRIQQLGLRTFDDYLHRVRRDAAELETMIDRITTNETHFFREPAHFTYLQETIVDGWIHAAGAGLRGKEVRVWSAGCSTGEEPYSIAMALLERLSLQHGWTIQVLATDISTRALEAARSATWSMERAREIPPHLLRRFMLEGIGSQAGRVRATPELRKLVRVESLNLTDAAYAVGGPFDMVLCRNVLIYFEQELRRRVVGKLASHVAPGGYFFVGHAESVQGVADLTCVRPTIYRKADAGRRTL